MKGSKTRRAALGDAENLRQLYQASIRGLGSCHYTPEQIDRWANRPIEAFAQDIQNTLVLVCEFESKIIGYAQFDLQASSASAVYVHPDYARRRVGSLLVCFLECDASSDDLSRLGANVSLNAVEFFRFHGYEELGPTLIPLADGTSLPGVRMEHVFFQKIEFASDQSLTDRVLTSLHCDHGPSRMRALQQLKGQSPQEVLDVIVVLLRHPEEAIRRRAGSGLTMYSVQRGEPINVEQKADQLADYLRHGEDPRVRLSCAIVLMSVHVPAVDRAYLHAMGDSDEKIVRLACLEVGDRGGPESAAALFRMLDHPQWHLVHLGSINTQGRANAVHATGDYAYVAESTRWTGSNLVSALEIFRITNYASLTVVGRYETSNAVNDVRVAGHHAYLAGGDAELTVLDVSRPQEPGPIGSFETNSVRHTGSVEVWGENACLVSDGILYVLNVSNPGQPILILTYGRTYPAYPGTTAIHLSKRHFYMAWAVGDWQGPSRAYLHVKDTTDPANWISVANFDLPVTGQDLQVNGSLLFVAFGQAGLWIYEITELPYFRSIARSGEGIVLSCNDLPGLKLQSTPSLTNLAWIDVPGSVGTNQMQLPRSGGHQFFRLVQPATP